MRGKAVAIRLSINGQYDSVEEGTTVAVLLQQREVRRDVVAVEINQRVIDPNSYDAVCLRPGDVIEFVYVMGGDAG